MLQANLLNQNIFPLSEKIHKAILENNTAILDTAKADERTLWYALLIAHQFELYQIELEKNPVQFFTANHYCPHDIHIHDIFYYLIRLSVTNNKLKLIQYIMKSDYCELEQKNMLIQDAFKMAAVNGYCDAAKLLMNTPYVFDNVTTLLINDSVFEHTAENGHVDTLKYLYTLTNLPDKTIELAFEATQSREIQDFLYQERATYLDGLRKSIALFQYKQYKLNTNKNANNNANSNIPEKKKEKDKKEACIIS